MIVTIKKHATFRWRITLEHDDGRVFDVSHYQDIKAKLRNVIATQGRNQTDFLEGRTHVVVDANPVPGEISMLELSLSAAITATLTSTESHKERDYPVIDVELTETAAPNDVVVLDEPLKVSIEESYAHD